MPTIIPIPIAWECANCACTNKSIEPGMRRECGAIDPIQYMIWKWQGGLPALTAISVQVDRPLQYLLFVDTKVVQQKKGNNTRWGSCNVWAEALLHPCHHDARDKAHLILALVLHISWESWYLVHHNFSSGLAC